MVSAWSFVLLAAVLAVACGAGAWRLARDPARGSGRSRRASRIRDAAAEAPRARARRGRGGRR